MSTRLESAILLVVKSLFSMKKRIRKVKKDDTVVSGVYIIPDRKRSREIHKGSGQLKKVVDGLFTDSRLEMLRACISEGMTRSEIARIMRLERAELAALERKLIVDDAHPFLGIPGPHRYYTFVLQQEQCVRDLDFYIDAAYENVRSWRQMLQNLPENDEASRMRMIRDFPSYQSAIAAIRAKSDIMERIIKMGQEMGVIEKRAKEMRVSGQVNLAALPTEMLREELQKKLEQLQNLVEQKQTPGVFRRVVETNDAN